MIPGSANPLLLASAAAAGGLQVSRSLRFNGSVDNSYLNRTPSVAGNRKTWTWSGWVKRAKFGNYEHIFAGTGSSPSYAQFYWSPSEQLVFDNGGSGAITTTQVFRDTSAWYHIVFIFDTTQGTAADRMRMYVNGSQITSFSSSSYPSQNSDGGMNQASIHYIGKENVNYSNFYLANIHFIDGQALTPASFAETDATTGQWIPKAFSGGSYGTNGFYLRFNDNSTTAALGTDSSGNGNTWTTNNLSVTAGAGNDSLVDSPTNYGTDTGVGGEVRGNYATWNPLSKASAATLSNGNLDASYTGSSYPHLGSDSTIFLPTSGKWYWEITVTTVGELWTGIRNVVDGKQSTYYRDGSGGFNNIRIEASSSTGSANAASYTSGDVIGVAVNCDGSTIAWYKNGSQIGTTYSLTNVANLVPFAGHASSSGSAAVVANWGARPFAYTAPSGFKALCTQNLPAPLVTKSNTVMDVALYTGTGATQSITGLAFNPDFVWLKRRSSSQAHYLYDVIRGTSSVLYSDGTDAEQSISTGLTSFNSDGFSLGSLSGVNASGSTYVGWAWDAGTSTVSNTQGSITSQVRANATAGFSVVTYTGTGSTATVGHGLGVAPSLILCKSRTATVQWVVYHASLGKDQFLGLNTTDAAITSSSYWGSGVTSTVFGLQNLAGGNNNGNMVAYCFSPVVGYSSFGSYVGNGSSDGPMVYTGMRPRWILIKSATETAGWMIYDTARDTYNQSTTLLYPNLSLQEQSSSNYAYDILSNGFKVRNSGQNNTSSATYIYAAFAEAPFNYSRAR